jgi:rhodanese-related sulfurtransferase
VSLSELPTVKIDAVTAALSAGEPVLDVREHGEWSAGHIDGAVHVPMNEIPRRLSAEPDLISPDTPVLVICKVGSRSAHVTAWLCQQGYDARNVEGGMLAWAHAHRPMITEDGSEPFVA